MEPFLFTFTLYTHLLLARWVYKVKVNKDGSIERFKSRFVVCGYSQVKGVDYTHSFSATMRATSFRLLMALATYDKLSRQGFDVWLTSVTGASEEPFQLYNSHEYGTNNDYILIVCATKNVIIV